MDYDLIILGGGLACRQDPPGAPCGQTGSASGSGNLSVSNHPSSGRRVDRSLIGSYRGRRVLRCVAGEFGIDTRSPVVAE